jgi:DNA-binding NtrC family response regulator
LTTSTVIVERALFLLAGENLAAVIAVERMKRKPNILVVDDERDITFVLKMLLSDDFDVDTYTDPEEALSKFQPRRYDLVLFDYLMPKMNGFEFYHTIKEADPDIKICMMTAYEAIPADKDTDSELPFSPKFVLKKPFDIDQMLAKLGEIMDGNRKT